MRAVQLVLPIEHYGPWIRTYKADPDCAALADRHYTRKKEKIGSVQFTRPGENLVLRTARGDAVWCSWKSKFRKDGFDAIESTIFRNESFRTSSFLIKWAIYATLMHWGGKLPPDGIITYVRDESVKSSNKGYCYKQAGFVSAGKSKGKGLTALRLTPEGCDLILQELSLIYQLKEVKRWMKVALISGEHMEAYDFQQDALSIEDLLQEVKRIMKAQRRQGWTEHEPPVPTEEFLNRLYGWIPEDCLQDCL